MSDGSLRAQPRLGGHALGRHPKDGVIAIRAAFVGTERTLPAAHASRLWIRRVALVLSFATGLVINAPGVAAGFTLKLVFPDGRPMTYGSACSGDGCLQRGDRLQTTNADGEVALGAGPSRTVEYRRDGIALARVPPGAASGRVVALGDRATVVLPRLLAGSAPAVDPVEANLVTRLNEARSAAGVPPAQLNASLSAAADLQAAWLTRSGVTFERPDLFHTGPFDTTMSFRRGEVSFPDAIGGEVVEAGARSPGEAVADWLASPPHRDQVLAPGRLVIGVGQVGSFVVVDTHPPCDGCERAGPGAPAAGALPLPGATPPARLGTPPPPARTATTPAAASGGGASDRARSCRREQLGVRRLADRDGRVRLRLRTSCLRRGGYALVVREGRSGRVLRTRAIARAGTTTLRLRPSRDARSLRIALQRKGRTVVAHAISLRR
jgi:uncharacterized protein YkwD